MLSEKCIREMQSHYASSFLFAQTNSSFANNRFNNSPIDWKNLNANSVPCLIDICNELHIPVSKPVIKAELINSLRNHLKNHDPPSIQLYPSFSAYNNDPSKITPTKIQDCYSQQHPSISSFFGTQSSFIPRVISPFAETLKDIRKANQQQPQENAKGNAHLKIEMTDLKKKDKNLNYNNKNKTQQTAKNKAEPIVTNFVPKSNHPQHNNNSNSINKNVQSNNSNNNNKQVKVEQFIPTPKQIVSPPQKTQQIQKPPHPSQIVPSKPSSNNINNNNTNNNNNINNNNNNNNNINNIKNSNNINSNNKNKENISIQKPNQQQLKPQQVISSQTPQAQTPQAQQTTIQKANKEQKQQVIIQTNTQNLNQTNTKPVVKPVIQIPTSSSNKKKEPQSSNFNQFSILQSNKEYSEISEPSSEGFQKEDELDDEEVSVPQKVQTDNQTSDQKQLSQNNQVVEETKHNENKKSNQKKNEPKDSKRFNRFNKFFQRPTNQMPSKKNDKKQTEHPPEPEKIPETKESEPKPEEVVYVEIPKVKKTKRVQANFFGFTPQQQRSFFRMLFIAIHACLLLLFITANDFSLSIPYKL